MPDKIKAVLRHLLAPLDAGQPVASLSKAPLKTFAHAFGFIAKVSRTIIIFSGKQFSGKDILASIMLKKMPNFKRVAIADIIKLTYGKQKNLTYEEIETNKPKYRPDLIAMGNWGRAQDPDYWLKKILEQDGNIFVTDVRMKHEYEVFKRAGAISIRVEAPREIRASRGILVNENDLTETELDDVTDWDYIVQNDGSLAELQNFAEHIIAKIS